MSPAISVCIPVYGTEEKLLSCLQSVANQQGMEGDGLEIIVVNDASPLPSADRGIESCSTIVSKFQKNCPYPVLYLEHQENQGLVEARRTAVESASGDYIFCLDSDDSIPSTALSALYKYAKEDDLDIVQGKGQILIATEGCQLEGDILAKVVKRNTEKAENVFLGKLQGPDILQSTLVKKEHNNFMWGKLIRRELYLRALEQIPSMYCTMAEDLVQYILIAHGACSYRGIPDIVYNYSVNTGISSHSTISTMERWEQVCSTASVFTVLFACMEELDPPFTEEQLDTIKRQCRFYVTNNLVQLRNAVIPELKEEAYETLCDYWGEGLVKRAEQMLQGLAPNKQD